MQSASVPVRASLPRLTVADGTLEALKWLGLIVMLGDHVNKYLLHESVRPLFWAGRLAVPLFAFVLAYNLARPKAMERGAYQRTMKRMAIAGALATPAFLALGGLLGGFYPLNIMFMLLAATATMFFIERGRNGIALAVFLLGGAAVEFWWPAVGLCLAAWMYLRKPSARAAVLAVLCCAALALINGNHWALAALPLLAAASQVDLALPRVRWAFYTFYPAHLYVLWLLKASHAGF